MANDLDILMASGKGAVSGGGKGLALGSNPALLAATGGLSAPIGAGIGAIVGGVSSGMKQNQADKASQLPVVDPLEAVRLAQLEQTRKNILTGSNPATQNKIQQIRNVGSAVQGGISRNTGGDVGATMDALLKAQKNTQAGVNNAVSEGQQNLPYFDSAVGTLSQRIAQRKADLWKINRDQMLAENAQSRKEANLNTNAMVGASGQLPSMEELLAMIQKRKMQSEDTSQYPKTNFLDNFNLNPAPDSFTEAPVQNAPYQPVVSQGMFPPDLSGYGSPSYNNLPDLTNIRLR